MTSVVTAQPGKLSRSALHRAAELRRGIPPAHGAEHPVAPGLQREVELRAELFAARHALGVRAVDPGGLERPQPHALDPLGRTDGLDGVQQRRAVPEVPAVAGQVDAREHDLAVAGLAQGARLGRNVRKAPRADRPAHLRDDAVGAAVVAALLDLHHGAGVALVGQHVQGLKGRARQVLHGAERAALPPRPLQQRHDLPPPGVAHDEPHARQGELLPLVLGHAPGHDDVRLRVPARGLAHVLRDFALPWRSPCRC